MEVTGYKLREVIKMKSLELNTLNSQFDENLHYFEGDAKGDPIALANKITDLEENIATLQTVQSQYNMYNKVAVKGFKEMPLEQAIKMVGGFGRRAKLFRNAAKGNKRDRYSGYRNNTRSADEIVAKETISKVDALEEAKKAEQNASRFRSAIALANSQAINLPMASEDLFS